MKNLYCLTLIGSLCGCAHVSPCGGAHPAKTVYVGDKCEERIRQVTLGSELPLPESLKQTDLVSWDLAWVDPQFENGQIIFGHFVLAPKKEVSK